MAVQITVYFSAIICQSFLNLILKKDDALQYFFIFQKVKSVKKVLRSCVNCVMGATPLLVLLKWHYAQFSLQSLRL